MNIYYSNKQHFENVILYYRTRLPSLFSSKDAMTASSSMGFSEHVEYTILPPSTSCSAPRVAIRSCKLRVRYEVTPRPNISRQHTQHALYHTFITCFYDRFTIKHKIQNKRFPQKELFKVLNEVPKNPYAVFRINQKSISLYKQRVYYSVSPSQQADKQSTKLISD